MGSSLLCVWSEITSNERNKLPTMLSYPSLMFRLCQIRTVKNILISFWDHAILETAS